MKMNKDIKKRALYLNCGLCFFLVFFVIVSLASTLVSAQNLKTKSTESVQAKTLILNAEKCLEEMQNREINVVRANESLQQAFQLYSAQIALEENGRSANYKLVNQSALEVCHIKDIAFETQDEMAIFDKTWNSASKELNISSISKTYDDIHKSFIQERFEDTVTLINQGYITLSNFEFSQTALNVFYAAITRSIKDFFVKNWRILSVIVIVIILLLIIFWKTIKKSVIQNKLDNMYARKSAIDKLVKKIQYDYFKKKTMSETEYNVKIKTFGDMTREIDRQIPEIREQLVKIDKKMLFANQKQGKKNENIIFKK